MEPPRRLLGLAALLLLLSPLSPGPGVSGAGWGWRGLLWAGRDSGGVPGPVGAGELGSVRLRSARLARRAAAPGPGRPRPAQAPRPQGRERRARHSRPGAFLPGLCPSLPAGLAKPALHFAVVAAGCPWVCAGLRGCQPVGVNSCCCAH